MECRASAQQGAQISSWSLRREIQKSRGNGNMLPAACEVNGICIYLTGRRCGIIFSSIIFRLVRLCKDVLNICISNTK